MSRVSHAAGVDPTLVSDSESLQEAVDETLRLLDQAFHRFWSPGLNCTAADCRSNF